MAFSMHQKLSKHRLIDSHAHIYALPDCDGAIAEAKASGIDAIIVPSEDLASNRTTINLAERYPNFIYPAVGYHPASIQLEDVDKTIEDIQRELPYCVALGEIGLDYKASLPKKHQKAVFSRLLSIAKAHEKPVIIHARYVHATVLSMLREAGINQAVFHAFNGALDVLFALLDAGYLISATPSTGRNEPHTAALRAAPLDRILIETDTPVIWGGAGGRPIHCWNSLKALAAVREVEMGEVAEHVFRNTVSFFHLATQG
jgi:TatD DNase family protein